MSSYFQVSHFQYQFFGDCTERTNINYYHCHFQVPSFFCFLSRSRYLSLFANIILLVESFSHQQTLMVLHWSWSNSKYPQVSRTLLSILTDINNARVKMDSRLLISKSSRLFFTNPSVTVSRAPITTSITVTFMFPIFSSSLARLGYLSFFSLSFNFNQWSAGTAKSTLQQFLFFCWLL